MRIINLELKNFKRFADLTIANIPLDVKLVLMIGANGSGKSSVFDAFEWLNALSRNSTSGAQQNGLKINLINSSIAN